MIYNYLTFSVTFSQDAVATSELFHSFLWGTCSKLLITISVTFAVPKIIKGFFF